VTPVVSGTLKCDLGFFFLVSVDFFLYFCSGAFFVLSFFFAKGVVMLKHRVCVKVCAGTDGRKLDKLK